MSSHTFIELLHGAGITAPGPMLAPWAAAFNCWLGSFPSHNTRRMYLWGWRSLLKHKKQAPWEISTADINAWMEALRDQGYAAGSIRIQYRAVRDFYNHISIAPSSREGSLAIENPATAAQPPQDLSSAYVLSLSELRGIFRCIRPSRSPGPGHLCHLPLRRQTWGRGLQFEVGRFSPGAGRPKVDKMVPGGRCALPAADLDHHLQLPGPQPPPKRHRAPGRRSRAHPGSQAECLSRRFGLPLGSGMSHLPSQSAIYISYPRPICWAPASHIHSHHPAQHCSLAAPPCRGLYKGHP